MIDLVMATGFGTQLISFNKWNEWNCLAANQSWNGRPRDEPTMKTSSLTHWKHEIPLIAPTFKQRWSNAVNMVNKWAHDSWNYVNKQLPMTKLNYYIPEYEPNTLSWWQLLDDCHGNNLSEQQNTEQGGVEGGRRGGGRGGEGRTPRSGSPIHPEEQHWATHRSCGRFITDWQRSYTTLWGVGRIVTPFALRWWLFPLLFSRLFSWGCGAWLGQHQCFLHFIIQC